MKGVVPEPACFYCGHVLPDDLTHYEDQVWITPCPTCGVVNALRPVDSSGTAFVVRGGFFNMRKPG